MWLGHLRDLTLARTLDENDKIARVPDLRPVLVGEDGATVSFLRSQFDVEREAQERPTFARWTSPRRRPGGPEGQRRCSRCILRDSRVSARRGAPINAGVPPSTLFDSASSDMSRKL